MHQSEALLAEVLLGAGEDTMYVIEINKARYLFEDDVGGLEGDSCITYVQCHESP